MNRDMNRRRKDLEILNGWQAGLRAKPCYSGAPELEPHVAPDGRRLERRQQLSDRKAGPSSRLLGKSSAVWVRLRAIWDRHLCTRLEPWDGEKGTAGLACDSLTTEI